MNAKLKVFAHGLQRRHWPSDSEISRFSLLLADLGLFFNELTSIPEHGFFIGFNFELREANLGAALELIKEQSDRWERILIEQDGYQTTLMVAGLDIGNLRLPHRSYGISSNLEQEMESMIRRDLNLLVNQAAEDNCINEGMRTAISAAVAHEESAIAEYRARRRRIEVDTASARTVRTSGVHFGTCASFGAFEVIIYPEAMDHPRSPEIEMLEAERLALQWAGCSSYAGVPFKTAGDAKQQPITQSRIDAAFASKQHEDESQSVGKNAQAFASRLRSMGKHAAADKIDGFLNEAKGVKSTRSGLLVEFGVFEMLAHGRPTKLVYGRPQDHRQLLSDLWRDRYHVYFYVNDFAKAQNQAGDLFVIEDTPQCWLLYPQKDDGWDFEAAPYCFPKRAIVSRPP